jgi:exodeoxyribonuclease VII large subunit
MNEVSANGTSPRVWAVGALCRAIADAMDARFNPVSVHGEISGFSRATSGHCYFSLKDGSGQIRCAMFRRSVGTLEFAPRDGDQVDVRGRLGVYEPRGELQLVVESMHRAGQGTLFEAFFRLKEKLELEGLFDAQRKRPLPQMPRGIGLVTSLGAAALHDVVSTLQRRVPHIPVFLAPAVVQGDGAPRAIAQALQGLYDLASSNQDTKARTINVILLVRGGGSIEDLWAFNDEQLARTIALSPVPVICGVGHETDFTIADFVADLRAPTPTAAAELVSPPRELWLETIALARDRVLSALTRHLDRQAQRLDHISTRLSRPSVMANRQRLQLTSTQHAMSHAVRSGLQMRTVQVGRAHESFSVASLRALKAQRDRVERAAVRLDLLDPALVLQRGYAWLTMAEGGTLARIGQAHAGASVHATLADGVVEMTVASAREN